MTYSEHEKLKDVTRIFNGLTIHYFTYIKSSLCQRFRFPVSMRYEVKQYKKIYSILIVKKN